LLKSLGCLGVVIGVVGLTSVVSHLHDAAGAFGLLHTVWFSWLGVVLRRTPPPSVT
jgi:hypothetical protein